MGQTPSNPTIATPSMTRYSPKYHVAETKQDPHYGAVKIIIEDETKEQQILKEISFSSQEDFDRELDYFTQRIQISHPNIASILGFSSSDQDEPTSSSFNIKIFIEMLDRDLQQDLQERKENNNLYNEYELLYIAENMISALYNLEIKGYNHGDIRPFNIFCCDKGYKLFDPSLASKKEQNGLINAIKNELKVFLSPELLAQVPEKDQSIHCNKFKADVFSLGITLLSLGSLTHGEDLYNYQTGKIDSGLLKERLESLKGHYSTFTYDLIRDMLAEREEDRPDFKALHTKLLPYQDNIHQKTDLPFVKSKQSHNQSQTGAGKVEKENLGQGDRFGKEKEIRKNVGNLLELNRSKVQEPVKTGGIIINPEDAVPSERENLKEVIGKNQGESYHYKILNPYSGNATISE